MRLLAAFFVCLVGSALANPRAKKSVCETTQSNYEACVASAHAEHREALSRGDDGKPDFYSRKSCNYIESTVKDCGELLIGDCFDADAVQEMRNNQFKTIVTSLEQAEEWDSTKCPAVKEWKDSLNDESEDDDEGDDDGMDSADFDQDGVIDSLDNDDDNDGVPDNVDNDDDNDGVPDSEDNDDDNDGIPDDLEDNDDDNDGVPDSEDNDDDNDGVPDDIDDDDDNDGVPDTEDNDDDNDGVPDDVDEDNDDDNDNTGDEDGEDSGASEQVACLPLLTIAMLLVK